MSEQKGFRLAQQILKDTSEQYGLRVKDVIGPNRSRVYLSCRAEIARALRDRIGMSTLEIGDVLNRDHTCVLEYLKK